MPGIKSKLILALSLKDYFTNAYTGLTHNVSSMKLNFCYKK